MMGPTASRVRLGRLTLVAPALAIWLMAPHGTVQARDSAEPCAVGTYRLSDGSDVDIGPARDARLRWRRKDGTTGELSESGDGCWDSTLGWTDRPDGKRVSFDCDAGTITFDGTPGRRIDFDVTETRFDGAGVELVGRLLLPRGDGPVPIVILVHGAENTSALDFYAHQRMFPSEGVGAFVYDKRGTGASGGRYSHDYVLLANDAIAAMREARRLAGARTGRVGYQGGSQGGWVAPLAARIEAVDFVIVSFGLAVSPLDEDREAIAYDMTRRGYGQDVIDKAMEVADATAEILRSGFSEGYDRLDAVRERYSAEPWFRHVRGNVSFYLLGTPPEEAREQGPRLLPDLPLDYDPMPVLRNLDVPQLWVLAEDDTDAPIGETLRRLKTLADEGRPITTVVFPDTDHGLYEYETLADGNRVSTRNPDGYFQLMRDFAAGGGADVNADATAILHPRRRAGASGYDPLSPLVGRWTIKGSEETYLEVCRWFDGNFHLVCETENKRPDGSIGRGMSILGYLPDKDSYTYYGIGSNGRNETMSGVFRDGILEFTAEAEDHGGTLVSRVRIGPFSERMVPFVAESSSDRTNWTVDASFTYVRID